MTVAVDVRNVRRVFRIRTGAFAPERVVHAVDGVSFTLAAGDVLGTVLPALGVALILGNLYYTFLARRLARRENRADVTALPITPGTP